jgi:O-antigen/teichoic acid export membrane protein
VDPARPRPGAARGRPAGGGGVAAGEPELSGEEKVDPPARSEEEAFDPTDFAEPEGGFTDTVVRGAGLAGAGFVASQVLTLGAFLVLARLASPSDFGDYAAGSILVSIGMLFTESGMLAALIHREDRIDEAASTAVVASFLSGILFSLLALAASPLIGLLFHSSRVGEIAAASSGMLVVRSLLIVPQALLQRRFSFLRRVIIEPLGVAVFGVVAIVLCAEGLGAWGLVAGYYAGAIVDVILSWVLIDWRPRLREASYEMWRELAGYGRHVLAAHTVMLGAGQLPILLIGRFSGSGALGQYRYAERLAQTPVGLVIQAGSYVLFPAFARITDDRRRFRSAMLRSLHLMCTFSFPLVILMIPLGVPAAMILFGPIWREAGYATMVLSGAAVGSTIISFASEVLKADGHPQLLTRVHVCLLIATTIASLALLPIGLMGVCAGISIGSLTASVYSLRQVRTHNAIPAGDFVAAVTPPLFGALLMAAILTPIEFLVIEANTRGTFFGLVLIILEGLVGLCIYAATMWAIDRRTLLELRDLSAGAIARRRQR